MLLLYPCCSQKVLLLLSNQTVLKLFDDCGINVYWFDQAEQYQLILQSISCFNRTAFRQYFSFNLSSSLLYLVNLFIWSVRLFQLFSLSIGQFIQSVSLFSWPVATIDDFLQSVSLFNRSVYSVGQLLQSMTFSSRSVYSVGQWLQSVSFFSRSVYSIGEFIQSVSCYNWL